MGMVHAGYYYDGTAGKTREDEYALLNEMGIVWLLRDFSWSSIQPAQDQWRLDHFNTFAEDAAHYNKKIVGILDYDVGWIHNESCGHPGGPGIFRRVVAGEAEVAAFCEYARQTVSRYKGKVGAWCIWNEPNLADRFWSGTPEEFFILTKAAAAAIREVDPGAVIMGGALNTLANDNIWTRGLFESGAMDQIDYIAYHPYMPDAVTTARAYTRFRDFVSKYKFADKIWVTEAGYPLNKGPGGYDTKVPEEFMPETVTKTITLLSAEGAQVILWYEMFDHGAAGNPNDSEHWFGLVNRDTFTKRCGGEAYQICALNLPGKTLRPSLPKRSGIPDNIAAYFFEGSNGKHSLVIWNNRLSQPPQSKVTLPGTGQQVWDVATGTPESISGETSPVYTLREGAGNSLLFFTWENNGKTPPRISAP
jgi:hypothetical protein